MAIYLSLKVKGTKSFLHLWWDTTAKEIGGMVYSCNSRYEKTSEVLKGYVIKDADNNEIGKIDGHGFRAHYDSMELFISVFDTNGVQRKLTLFNPEADAKFQPPVIMEA